MSLKPAPFVLAAAFTLMLSGAALARRPPALAQQQQATARVLAFCPQPTTSGYRDMLARGGGAEARIAAERVSARAAARQKLDSEVVLTCAGAVVHTGSGYRDMFLRFEPESARPLMARLTR